MIVHCQNCGHEVMVNGLGRPRLNIPLKIICEALETHRSLAAAAQELGCSRAYIFRALKINGLRLKDVITPPRKPKRLSDKQKQKLHQRLSKNINSA